MLLKSIYIVFIGLLLATFVGVGIAAFYPEPLSPQPPASLKYCASENLKNSESFQQFKDEAEQQSRAEKNFELEMREYNRNASTYSLIAAIIILAGSLTVLRHVALMADGFLLGGVLTLAYSILRGFGAEDNKYRFVVVAVGLVISLLLGYLKFVKATTTPSAKRSR